MPGCAVANCNNYSKTTKTTKVTNIRYFRFPKEEEYRKKWIIACKRDKINLKNACICSAHFEPSCFEEPSLRERLMPDYQPKNKRPLKHDSLPTLNMPGRKKSTSNSERSSRMAKRRKLCESISDNLDTTTISKEDTKNNEIIPLEKNEQEIPISEGNQATDEFSNLREKIRKLENENSILKQKLNSVEGKLEEMKTMIGKICEEQCLISPLKSGEPNELD